MKFFDGGFDIIVSLTPFEESVSKQKFHAENDGGLLKIYGQQSGIQKYAFADVEEPIEADIDSLVLLLNLWAISSLRVAVWSFVSKTANYTVKATDHFINCTSNTFTVTLPTAVGIVGKPYIIKNSGTGAITVDGDGTETIDDATTATLNNQYESITVTSNGANWRIS